MWRYKEAHVALHLFTASTLCPVPPPPPGSIAAPLLQPLSAGSFLCKLTDFSSQVDSNFGAEKSVQISHVFN